MGRINEYGEAIPDNSSAPGWLLIILVILAFFIFYRPTNNSSSSPTSAQNSQEIAQRIQRVGEVHIASGRFRLEQALNLRNTVTITGAGRSRTVLIISSAQNGAALRFQGNGVLTLRDLAIEYDGALSADVIRIERGTVRLENIEVKSGRQNARAPRQSIGSGIILQNNSRITISNSLFHNNERHGIMLLDNSSGTLSQSIFSENGYQGVVAAGASRLVLEDEVVTRGNGQSGIVLFENARMRVQNSASTQNNRHGLVLMDSSQATVGGSQFISNGFYGIYVGRSARLIEQSGNRLWGNQEAAIGRE